MMMMWRAAVAVRTSSASVAAAATTKATTTTTISTTTTTTTSTFAIPTTTRRPYSTLQPLLAGAGSFLQRAAAAPRWNLCLPPFFKTILSYHPKHSNNNNDNDTKNKTRMIGQQQRRWHGGGVSVNPDQAPRVNVTFVLPDKKKKVTVQALVGETLLQTAHRQNHGNDGNDDGIDNNINLEGACEGVCACSTCHLILPPEIFDTLGEASEEEEDMLDMAYGLTVTSRLGCQVVVTPEMEGAEFQLPTATRNFYVDGHVPKPH